MNKIILDNPFEMDLRELEYKRKKNNEEEVENLLNNMEQYLKELVRNTKEILDALERAYNKGYYDALQRLSESEESD